MTGNRTDDVTGNYKSCHSNVAEAVIREDTAAVAVIDADPTVAVAADNYVVKT